MGYILFSSEKVFCISALKTWNGTLEYSFDNNQWNEWRGKDIYDTNIYMRGINNSVISDYGKWIFHGQNIRCQGNIENLLDYTSVINNVHPKMSKYCFAYMFEGCRSLITAPSLSSVTLSKDCYVHMFEGCTSLITSPVFPNLAIAKEAIINQRMFHNCPIQIININNKLYDINVLKLL